MQSEKIVLLYLCRKKKEKLKFEREIKNLDVTKVAQNTDILTKVFKQNRDIFSEFFHTRLNKPIEDSVFPSCLRKVDITPVFKTVSRCSRDNYRPVSILPNISKIFEKCMFKQITVFFDKFFSKYQCGF